ncbi:hypothetical protein Trydic_g20501 [Trypoxylus dichotomus]
MTRRKVRRKNRRNPTIDGLLAASSAYATVCKEFWGSFALNEVITEQENELVLGYNRNLNNTKGSNNLINTPNIELIQTQPSMVSSSNITPYDSIRKPISAPKSCIALPRRPSPNYSHSVSYKAKPPGVI